MIIDAQAEARELRHDHVAVEHFVLELLRERDSAAAPSLCSRGASIGGFRAALLAIVPEGEHDLPAAQQLPFTPRAKKVLELALREALALGTDWIGPEHLLLGITRENESVAVQILRKEWGFSAEVIRGSVIEIMPAPQRDLIPSARGVAVPRIARSPGSMGVTLEPSPPVRRLLMAAGALALDGGRTEIDIEDIWLALMRERTAVQLASELGADEPKVRAAIARRGGAVEPPDASATG